MVFTAVVSGLLQFILFPNVALLGASGIVFMLIMLASLSGMTNGRIPLTLILVAVLYLGQEVYSMLFVQDSVANFMHIVGGACGTAFGFSVGRRKRRR
jgi:membrane associated rhomboid family serine protease